MRPSENISRLFSDGLLAKQKACIRSMQAFFHSNQSIDTAENQRGIGAAEAEAVGHHGIEFHLAVFAQNRQAFCLFVQVSDVRAGAGKIVLHHQNRVNRFVRTCRAEGVAGKRFGGADERDFLSGEHFADGTQFFGVADRRGSAVGVDVINFAAVLRQCHLHTAHRAFAGRLHHVVTVGSRAVAGQFAQDVRAARFGVFIFFHHQDAAAAGNHEAVAVGIVGAAGLVGRVVVFAR